MTLEPSYQQALTPVIGEARALQSCVPTCFYMLARAYGYLADVDLAGFVTALDWNVAHTPGQGWSRPQLSHQIRTRFNVAMVSWMLTQPAEPNFDRMIESGYLQTDREINWFKQNLADWPIDVVVAAGTPVIVSVKPGFASNKSQHTVILAQLVGDKYEIIDPDERNPQRFYSIDQLHAGLAPAGAASVILPRL